MILIIDNYDSFSYNLVQVIGRVMQKEGHSVEQIKVVRNDEITVEEVKQLNPSHIILSPGPGRPKDAGICEELIQKLYKQFKILGVCLGHQAICETFGATITYAKELMHGKQSEVAVNNKCSLFKHLKDTQIVARYHSLVAKADTVPDELEVMSTDEDGQIMAVKHKQYEVYGVQFHPESVLTPQGEQMLSNFLLEE